jgi:uncharacterized protein YoxC
MNIISEERESIIQNNNTAQQFLLSILDNFEPQMRELAIHESLHGNLDFSVITTRGFKNVKSILLFEKGEVTSISNLPEGLEKLVASHQYLIELENLPKSIKEIDVQHNFISDFDISSLKHLKVLQVSDNHFTKLENIPDSLEELYCNNNRIKVLNLKETLQLRVLHTSNNKAIIIENLPPSVVDFKSENNPFIEIGYSNLHSSQTSSSDEPIDKEEKVNYVESIFDYFKLKNKYEENLHKEKKRIFEKASSKKQGKKNVARWVPKCIQCKQPGGTLFSKNNETYHAVCGNKQTPCNLKIEIYNGKIYPIDELLTTFGLEELVTIKENIMKQKLDNIFTYENEKSAMKKFKENLEEFTFLNNETMELIEKNNQLYKDHIRQDMIERKTHHIYDLISSIKELIQQYKKDGNGHLLKTAVEIQVNELNPEIHNLRMLKYEIMEMNYKSYKKMKKGADEGGAEDEAQDIKESSLYQRYPSLQKMEILMGKPPVVVKYSTTK